jgi:hypothetical protein
MGANMGNESDAWVWSHYRGVISERDAESSTETRSPADQRVVPLRPVPGSAREAETQKATQRRIKYGVVIGLAVLAGLFFPIIAALLIVVAGLLIASGREQKKVDDFLASVPGGSYVSKALLQLDNWLA